MLQKADLYTTKNFFASNFLLTISGQQPDAYLNYSMFDRSFLIKMVQAKMPFGQYKDWYVTSLPVHYLEWFSRQGFPKGQLGQYLATMFEIKTNGLEDILKPIIREYRNSRN